MNVLVVDDEPDVVKTLTLLLGFENHTVWTADSAEDALGLLEEGPPPDVVLVDLRLPGISGWELIDRIDEEHGTLRIRCVILSAHAGKVEIDRAAARGIPWVTKPFHVEELLRLLADLAGW